MRVGLTMAAAAACAWPSLTAGPAAVPTTKSWMPITSPAKVLSSFTRRKGFHHKASGGLWKIHFPAGVKACKESWAVVSICQLLGTLSSSNLKTDEDDEADLLRDGFVWHWRSGLVSLVHLFVLCCSSAVQPTPPTCPRPSASPGSLPARTTAASRSAGSATGTTIAWTTATRPLSSAVSHSCTNNMNHREPSGFPTIGRFHAGNRAF